MKKCIKCQVEKELAEFSKNKTKSEGVQNECKSCAKEYKRNYYKKNKEKVDNKNLKYYYSNKEELQAKQKKYREKNVEKVKEKQRLWRAENIERRSLYQKNNRKQINESAKNKYDSDSLHRLYCSVRNRTSDAFNRRRWNKNSRNVELLGCSFEVAHKHLERQFVSGMSWLNHGEWEIDHIIPLASATTEEELKKLCHYSNLQPLWKKENSFKRAKMPSVQIPMRL